MTAVPALLTVFDVAETCNVSEITVRRWITAGHLPAIRLRGVVRVDPADLATLIESGRSQSASSRLAPPQVSVVRPLPKRKRPRTR